MAGSRSRPMAAMRSRGARASRLGARVGGDVEARLPQPEHGRHELVDCQRSEPLFDTPEVAGMEREDRATARFPHAVAGAEADERRLCQFSTIGDERVAQRLSVIRVKRGRRRGPSIYVPARPSIPARRARSSRTDSRSRSRRPSAGRSCLGRIGDVGERYRLSHLRRNAIPSRTGN